MGSSKRRRWSGIALLGIGVLTAGSAASIAGKADVVAATAIRSADGTYVFIVTVRHADAGWQHYADRFEIVAPDGSVIGTRVLAHPHDDEQPFTRELAGVRVPAGVGEVIVRAHDKVHGLGGREVSVRIGN